MASLLCRSAASHRFLCVLLASLTALSPSLCAAEQAAAAPASPDAAAETATSTDGEALVYVTPGACVVVTMRPAQLFNSPAAEMFPNEVLQAAVQTASGIDPLTVEELVISWSPPSNYAVLARSATPISLDGPITDRTSPDELNGKEYLKSRSHLEPSFYAPDERSVLAAPDFIVQELVEGGAPKRSDILKNFTDETAQDDFHLAVNVTMLRPLIAMAMWNAKLPPEFAALRDVPGMISHVDLRFNISHAAPTELVVTANHAADANRLESTVETLKRNALAQLDREVAKEFDGEEPVQAATRAYQRRVNQKIFDSLQLERRDNQLVVFRTEAPTSENGAVLSVATIGVLVGLLLPAVQAAREAARRNQSMNNIKQLMLCLHNYHDSHKRFPAYANFDADGKPLLSWRVHILPYLEQQALYEQFHLDEPWDSEHNKELIAKMPPEFLSPSSKNISADGKSNYLGVLGEDYVFDGSEQGRSMKTITDGLSNSIAIVSVDDESAVAWTKPDDWTPSDSDLMEPFDGAHTGGFLAGFCDGHVQMISSKIDPTVLRALLTVAGEEAIESP
ncbi:DUF1559 domain-containing protein [Lacipirellula sp.]|uniref:DUF1559 domain-containing protein n=1 Tax=Lacipirellula sp. TaxID=2691419 RepID=UPI003D128580